MNISPLTSGRSVMQQAYQRVNSAAGTIASPPPTADGANPRAEAKPTDAKQRSDALIELKQGEIQGKAGVRVLQAGRDTIGTLLDIRA